MVRDADALPLESTTQSEDMVLEGLGRYLCAVTEGWKTKGSPLCPPVVLFTAQSGRAVPNDEIVFPLWTNLKDSPQGRWLPANRRWFCCRSPAVNRRRFMAKFLFIEHRLWVQVRMPSLYERRCIAGSFETLLCAVPDCLLHVGVLGRVLGQGQINEAFFLLFFKNCPEERGIHSGLPSATYQRRAAFQVIPPRGPCAMGREWAVVGAMQRGLV